MYVWRDAKNCPPAQEGDYLVCTKLYSEVFSYDVCSYSLNLHEVDKYDFDKKEYRRPGWYDCDSEYGYYEVTNVVGWMPLPPIPESLKAGA